MTVLPEHPLPWTADEFLRTDFGDAGRRLELWDGNIVMTPALTRRHQEIARRLVNAIESALEGSGRGLRVEGPVNYRMSDDDVVAPDVIVFHDDVRDDLYLEPDEVEVLIEVTSTKPNHDRVTKMNAYARTGAPWYWIVDQRTLQVDIFQLVKGIYTPACTLAPGNTATTAQPFDFVLDPASLVRSPG